MATRRKTPAKPIKKRAADLAAKAGAQVKPLNAKQLQATIRSTVRSELQRSNRTTISTVSNNDYLGPQQPVAPQRFPDQPEIRDWQYLPGYNVNFQPRKYLPTTFAQLRWCAREFDLLRAIIERRENEIAGIDWEIVARDGTDLTNDPQVKAITQFFATPDGEHDFPTWQRALLQEMYVTDAACLYPVISNKGAPLSFNWIDGATILPLIDGYGRLPNPPDPAYQQVWEGIPYEDYSKDELVYKPRNPSVWMPIYGYPQVEQCLLTIAIGIKAELRHYYYFSEGSIPDSMVGVPDSWSSRQLATFQAWFDALMRGNLQRRSGGVTFVPGGLKEVAMKDYAFDLPMWEWIARVICSIFNVSPQPYVQEQNRATAATAQVMAISEGLEPDKQWFAGLMDLLLHKYFKRPDLQFKYKTDETVDILEKATADDKAVRNGTKLINEIRLENGDQPVEGGDKPFVIVGNQAVMLTDLGSMSEMAVTPPPAPIVAGPNGKPAANGNGNGKPKPAAKSGAKVAKSAMNGREYFESDGWLIPKDIL